MSCRREAAALTAGAAGVSPGPWHWARSHLTSDISGGATGGWGGIKIDLSPKMLLSFLMLLLESPVSERSCCKQQTAGRAVCGWVVAALRTHMLVLKIARAWDVGTAACLHSTKATAEI